MVSLTRWQPIGRTMSLREAMDRLFEDSFVGAQGALGDNLAIDMYETGEDIVVKASVPGVKPEDIDINIQGDILTIRGEMKEEQEVNEGDYHRRERRYGSFIRSVQLPVNVQVDKAEAESENGILTLRLPKAEEAKPRTINVRAKNGEQQKRMEGKATTTK